MTSFMTLSFVKFVFADSQRSCLLFRVGVVDYVPAEFTQLLANFFVHFTIKLNLVKR